MATTNETLFYTVSGSKAQEFIDQKTTEKVIGFVEPDPTDKFGYIIAGGKRYGASYNDINSIAYNNAHDAYTAACSYITTNFAKKITVSDTDNKIDSDGAEYTLSISDSGVLSLSKYIAAKWEYLTASDFTTSTETVHVDYKASYTISAAIGVDSAVIAYSISAGTETISGAKIALYHDGGPGNLTLIYACPSLDAIKGKISLSVLTNEKTNLGVGVTTLSGVATENVSVSHEFENNIKLMGYFKNSANTGVVTYTTVFAESVTNLVVTYPWFTNNTADAIAVKNEAGDDGVKITATTGTKYSSSGKPKSITFKKGEYGWIALPASGNQGCFQDWSFTDIIDSVSNESHLTAWQVSPLNVYNVSDYKMYQYIDGTTGKPTTFSSDITFNLVY